MNPRLRRWLCPLLVVLLLVGTPRRAKAVSLGTAVGLGIAGVAVGVTLIIVTVVLAVKHKPAIEGCASDGPEGLTLPDTKDKQTYLLKGKLARLTAGQQVKIRGRRNTAPGGKHEFEVLKVEQTFGACPVTTASQPS